MEEYKYIKVDAFTSELSSGNPAACIFLNNNQTLTDDEMLSIARQHKGFVCEMVFCKKIKGIYNLTYFSSECEVEFCGHGTIACMYSLIKSNAELSDKDKINIQTCRKGKLVIYNSISTQDCVYISAPKPIYLSLDNLSAKMIYDNMGLSENDISTNYPIDFIDAGNRTLILPINSLEKEVSLFPDEQILKQFTLNYNIDVILIFCMDTENKEYFAHTRIFAAKFGYLEDPATGSGNSAFGYYMLKNNMWNGDSISLEQGGNDRIFNTVKLEKKNGNLLFGGSATTRIDGVYYF